MKSPPSKITIQFEAELYLLPEVVNLLAPLGIRDVRVLQLPTSTEPIKHEADENQQQGEARKIAEAIRPRNSQTMRLEVLKAALGEYDSFINQKGVRDHGMRVGLALLSKALRPFAKGYASPMDLIATREREYFEDGTYRGTVYKCTELGKLVRDELVAMGVLS